MVKKTRLFAAIAILFFSGIQANETLLTCIEKGDYNAVVRRIKGGDNINKQGTWTPLNVACIYVQKDILRLLLDNGADPNLKNNSGAMPLAVLTRCLGNIDVKGRDEDCAEMVQCLIDFGAKVDSTCNAYYLALDWAVQHKSSLVVDVLLRNGADVSITGPLVDKATQKCLLERQKELLEESLDFSVERNQEKEILKNFFLGDDEFEGPWDGLPFGRYSDRLNILQQLIKKTKSSTEKKILEVLLVSEIAFVKDKLQYDIKRLQWLVANASEQGKRDKQSERFFNETLKHMTALEVYINSLSKSERCRINEITLPGKHWTPENKKS